MSGLCSRDEEEVQEINQLVVRWLNAAFRLMFHLNRSEGHELVLADELLTEEEWDEIKDFPKPAMHLYQWTADVIATCHERGYIRSDVILGQMQSHLETMRANDAFGGPSLPYVYTLFVTVLVKLYLFLFCFYAAGFIWRIRVLREMPGWEGNLQTGTAMDLTGVWQTFMVVCVNFFYQGALDLHSLLRHPNKGDLLGHVDVLGMCNNAKKLSNNLIKNARRRHPGSVVGLQQLQMETNGMKTEECMINVGQDDDDEVSS